jgi:glycine cleavage system H protein
MEFPAELRYTKEHEWVRVEGEEAVFGITDYAQDQLGDITYVEFPAEDDQLTQDEPFGTVEAVKAVADINSPVTGKVLAVNETVNDDASVVNSDPYVEGWLVRAQINNPAELDSLMSADEYIELVKELGGDV